MNATLDAPPTNWGDFLREMNDRLRALGDIPPHRVRMNPRPGTATIDDLLNPENEGCELVDGTLVEKAMGWEESFLASWLLTTINNHVLANNLGAVTCEQGMFELPDGPVRGPDVAFTAWATMPGRVRPREAFPNLAPDLVIEILSPRNTAREMARKRREYFRAGVRLLWEINPRTRTVVEYTADDAGTQLPATGSLDGGAVLPGLSVPLADLFGELDRRG